MKKNKFKIIIAAVCTLFVTQAYGQITVGADSDPAPYSIIEVVGDEGGVRLPRMTATEIKDLESTLTSHSESEGLLVYNTTNSRIEFWNGSSWVALSSSYDAENGITLQKSPDYVLELGGNLTKETTIDQNGNQLNFALPGNSEFKAGLISAKNNEVNFNLPSTTGSFKVNEDALSIQAATNSIDIKAEKVNIDNNLFALEASTATPGVSVNGTFQYKDGKEEAGYLLVSDATGNASWEGVRPFGTLMKGHLSNDLEFKTSADYDVTTSPLKLSPGQWMIMAKATIETTGSSGAMYYWMQLTDNDNTMYTKTGINPEMVSSGTVYATPSLVHYVNITTEKTFYISIGSSNKKGSMTSKFGGSYFYAIRLDVPN